MSTRTACMLHVQAYLTKAPAEVVSGGHLVAVLGVFQKLIASKVCLCSHSWVTWAPSQAGCRCRHTWSAWAFRSKIV